MTKLTNSTTIDAPPEKVWRYVADLDSYPKWSSGVEEAKWLSSQHGGVGARGKMKMKRGEHNFEAELEITEWDENRKIGFRTTAGNITGFGTIAFEPRGKKTELTSVTNYELPYSILGKMIDRLKVRNEIKKGQLESNENLKKLCEK